MARDLEQPGEDGHGRLASRQSESNNRAIVRAERPQQAGAEIGASAMCGGYGHVFSSGRQPA